MKIIFLALLTLSSCCAFGCVQMLDENTYTVDQNGSVNLLKPSRPEFGQDGYSM